MHLMDEFNCIFMDKLKSRLTLFSLWNTSSYGSCIQGTVCIKKCRKRQIFIHCNNGMDHEKWTFQTWMWVCMRMNNICPRNQAMFIWASACWKLKCSSERDGWRSSSTLKATQQRFLTCYYCHDLCYNSVNQD